jgi:RimJ/RimL family protein N-acetyltransferase
VASDSHTPVILTERLALRRFSVDDAAFVLALFNDADFIRFIGDRGVRDLDAARTYIQQRFIDRYAGSPIGPFAVTLPESPEPIGFCSLFRRDWLDDVDLGFAFLPRWRARGYAYEASEALLRHAREHIGLPRLHAITSIDNHASVKLLARLGFQSAGLVKPPDEDSEVRLFTMTFDAA